MADSTAKLTQLTTSQYGKEATVNDLIAALSLAGSFSRNTPISGLTWSYVGCDRWHINATATTKANSGTAVAASSTRYVSVNRALTVSNQASVFPPAELALAKVVTGASTFSSWEDHRDPHHINRFLYGHIVKAMGDANYPLTYQEAMCESIECTGTNTALRDLVVPLVPRSYIVFANTTTNGVQVISTSGTGVTIAVGKRAMVQCDGTNVVRITADV